MDAIVAARGGGKTHTLMTKYFLVSDDYLLIVPYEGRKQQLIREYAVPKSKRDRIIVWYSFEECAQGMQGTILIDDLDTILQECFHGEIQTVTFSGCVFNPSKGEIV